MAGDISREIREHRQGQIEARDKQERIQAQVQRDQDTKDIFTSRLVSVEGISIPDARTVIDEEARMLLAGFVASASRFGIIPGIFKRRPPLGYGVLAKTVEKLVDKHEQVGWGININQYDCGSYSDEDRVCSEAIVLSPDYRLYSRFTGQEPGKGFQTPIIHQTVVGELSRANADWVEPDPSTYK